MTEKPTWLTVRELRRGIDRLVGSPSNSYTCLSKTTTARVDSLFRHGDFDHTRPHTRKSAMLTVISDEAGFKYDTASWSSPQALTKPQLVLTYYAVKEALNG